MTLYKIRYTPKAMLDMDAVWDDISSFWNTTCIQRAFHRFLFCQFQEI